MSFCDFFVFQLFFQNVKLIKNWPKKNRQDDNKDRM